MLSLCKGSGGPELMQALRDLPTTSKEHPEGYLLFKEMVQNPPHLSYILINLSIRHLSNHPLVLHRLDSLDLLGRQL